MLKLKSNVTVFSLGFVAGVGVGAMGREIVENGGQVFKPLVKSIVKGAVTLMEKGRESLAFFSESFEDVVAEARSELRAEPKESVSDIAEAEVVPEAAGMARHAARSRRKPRAVRKG